MKICRTCIQKLDLDKFGKNINFADGYRSECKECRNFKLRTGKINTGRFKKGSISLRKGVKLSVSQIEKMSLSRRGQIPWNKGKFTTGEKRSRRFKNWARIVKERDGNLCKKCGSNEKLHAHHIFPWKENEEKRFDIENGMTLCNSCHSKHEGFQKGHKFGGYWKGKNLSEEAKKKMSDAKKGHPPWNKGSKGICKAWNKGTKGLMGIPWNKKITDSSRKDEKNSF